MRCPVSVIIPTWNRLDDLRNALSHINECSPLPAETIVHVDANDTETAPWLRRHRPDVRILESDTPQGPGGGRNRLLRAASEPFVASFDDDSYPTDTDYFERLISAFHQHTEAGIIASSIYHRGEPIPPSEHTAEPVSSFVGCGCAYRAKAWNDLQGYVPLPLAYGMEEADVALQCLDADWTIVHDRRLRVFHDTDLSHHEAPSKTAAAICNRALLAYLRYPASYLWLGLAQYLSRIVWSIQAGRTKGVLSALRQTPGLLWTYRRHRDPVSAETLREARRLQARSTSSPS